MQLEQPELGYCCTQPPEFQNTSRKDLESIRTPRGTRKRLNLKSSLRRAKDKMGQTRFAVGSESLENEGFQPDANYCS